MTTLRGGASLRDDLFNLKITRKPLIHELLFERDIFLLSADAGAGKSIFALNLLAALSYPHAKRFLGLKVERAVKTLYIQLEGDYEESIERLRLIEMGGSIMDENNIMIAEEKMLDVMSQSSVWEFLEKIEATKFKPEVVIIDPLYKLTPGDPKEGNVAQAIIKFSDQLYNTYNCTNVLMHHNLKDSYDSKGDKIRKDDAFYGHSFLKNHVRTSYAMSITGDHSRMLTRKKGRGADTVSQIAMTYDPESHLLEADQSNLKYKGDACERIIAFLEACRKEKRHTTAREIESQCHVSYGYIRQIKQKPEIQAEVKFIAPGHKQPEQWIPLPKND